MPPEPFEPTGWKTVLLDHFSCKVEDHEKEAAYYNALMNWGVRSDNGTEAVLDIGNWGGLIIRGGYTAPPPTAWDRLTVDSRPLLISRWPATREMRNAALTIT